MNTRERILVVEDDDDMRVSCRQVLEMAGHAVLEAGSATEAEPLLSREPVDVVVTDLRMPNGGGEEVLKKVKALCPGTPVLIITAYPSVESAVEAFRGGVADYLLKPFTGTQLVEAIDRALLARRADDRASVLRHMGAATPDLPHMIGASPAFRELLAAIRRFAAMDSAVVVNGETGSGKELVARALHALSRRADGPFVDVNCAAIPDALIESELFGHERGAFSGALSAKPGLFEVASGGTLFLDEVAELSAAAQAKLLRCLEERAVRRVGALSSRAVDVRIVTATHKTLAHEVAAGHFREDLMYRLAVLEVRVPPLRERPEDIPTLAVHFLDRLRKESGREVVGFTEDALGKLAAHTWPGNVRELQNVVQKAFALCTPPVITGEDVALRAPEASPAQAAAAAGGNGAPLGSALDAFEERHIADEFKRHGGNVTHTARALGIHRTTLQRLIKRFGIGAEETR
jgi:DNA-binding NtrC family response regulator